jgi:hypothetical protein
MKSRFFGASIALLVAVNLAAQSVGVPEANPKVVVAGMQTTISVTSSITAPNPVPTSVALWLVDDQGRLLASLGSMANAGGGLFSIQVPLTIPLGGSAFLAVVASFPGKTGLVQSASVTISSVKQFFAGVNPEGIQQFLTSNGISSAAQFLQYLDPANFKRDWIFMTASASSQPSTAAQPRVIVQSRASDEVYGFQLGSNVIEYMQWQGVMDPDDPNRKINQFRFHTIDTGTKTVTVDDSDCLTCHTNGNKVGWPYPRPNWDAYDSWGGAMPFNRDRIYYGSADRQSIEWSAMKALLKASVADPILAQLNLPPGMTRDGAGNVTIPFDLPGIDSPDENPPEGSYPNVNFPDLLYAAVGVAPTYPGLLSQGVAQGGPFFLMRSSFSTGDPAPPAVQYTLPSGDPGTVQIGPTDPVGDGGRAVAMFDHFSAFNARRIAQELADSWNPLNGLGQTQVDIRPVALAIAMGCVGDPADRTNLEAFSSQDAVNALLNFFEMDNSVELYDDTTTRQESLPQMKANQQSPNDYNLLVEYGAGASDGAINDEVARRSQQGRPVQFPLDKITKFMIDREVYTDTKPITLFRFFLEPVGVKVIRWDMSVFGRDLTGKRLDHTGTYTFADKFTNTYIQPIIEALAGAGDIAAQLEGKDACTELATLSKAAFAAYK